MGLDKSETQSGDYLTGQVVAAYRQGKHASLLRISGALHLALFEQPGKDDFSSSLEPT
jgi:hypothetical protein